MFNRKQIEELSKELIELENEVDLRIREMEMYKRESVNNPRYVIKLGFMNTAISAKQERLKYLRKVIYSWEV